jgi:putative tricarboxylic transport membrane protein
MRCEHSDGVARPGMRDRIAGLVVCALGASVAIYAQTFPPMPGQRIGPSFFPTIVGLLLAALGVALVASPGRGPAAEPATASPAPSARMRANFAAVVAVLLFYALAVDWLGFFITGTAFLATLMLMFGVRGRWILPVSVAVTVALHYGFYTVLRVPLPWGLLDAIAW